MNPNTASAALLLITHKELILLRRSLLTTSGQYFQAIVARAAKSWEDVAVSHIAQGTSFGKVVSVGDISMPSAGTFPSILAGSALTTCSYRSEQFHTQVPALSRLVV